jgi:hypothetical protein
MLAKALAASAMSRMVAAAVANTRRLRAKPGIRCRIFRKPIRRRWRSSSRDELFILYLPAINVWPSWRTPERLPCVYFAAHVERMSSAIGSKQVERVLEYGDGTGN